MRFLQSVAMAIIVTVGTSATAYACGPNQEFNGSVKMPYEKKGFSSKPKAEDLQAARGQAVRNAWDAYIAKCFEQGRMQQYLQLEEQVMASMDRFVAVKAERSNVDEKARQIDFRVKITVNRALLDGMFTAGSGSASGGDPSVMAWIFAARQAMSTEGGTLKQFKDREVDIRAEESAATGSQAEIIDGSSAVVSEESERMSRTESGGSVTKRGDIVTSSVRDYELVSTADIDKNISGVLSLNNYEPADYMDVLINCGGEELEVVQAELSMEGQMSRETRRSVIMAMRDCGVEYLAIGTIDINTPTPDDVSGGYRVNVSVNGEVLDLTARLPKKVAVIGPVQRRSGGVEDNEAIRNALSSAGEVTAQEIVARLNAKGIQ